MKTKSTILYLLITVLFAGHLQAQQFIDIGLRAGFNASKFTGSDSRKDQLLKPGYHAGLSVEAAVYKNLSVQSGLLLSNKGTRYKQLVDVNEGGIADREENRKKWTSNYVYIELPLYAVYHFEKSANKLYAGAGPYFGYNVSMYTRQEGGDKKKNQFNDYNRRLDAGLGIVAGCRFTEQLSAQLGMTKGLAGISKGSTVKNHINNFVLNLSVAYHLHRFNFK